MGLFEPHICLSPILVLFTDRLFKIEYRANCEALA